MFDILDVFEEYANKTNDACDGEKRSFDAMVLCTGSGRQSVDVSGLAITGAICDM